MTPTPHLAEARKAAGLSQQALADRLGVAQQHVARWEREVDPVTGVGPVVPNAWMAVRLSEALGTTANAIWPAQRPDRPGDEPPRESQRTRRRREYDERKRREAEAQTPQNKKEPAPVGAGRARDHRSGGTPDEQHAER